MRAHALYTCTFMHNIIYHVNVSDYKQHVKLHHVVNTLINCLCILEYITSGCVVGKIKLVSGCICAYACHKFIALEVMLGVSPPSL